MLVKFCIGENEFIFMFPFKGVAVLGIALIAMGEEIGSEMALRTFGHLVSSTSCYQFSFLVLFVCTFTEYVIVSHLSFLLLLMYVTYFLPLSLFKKRPFCLVILALQCFHIFRPHHLSLFFFFSFDPHYIIPTSFCSIYFLFCLYSVMICHLLVCSYSSWCP